MIKIILVLIELGLAVLSFLLVLNLTTSMMYYYQQSTGSMIHMMNTLEDALPTNYTSPYENVPNNFMSPVGFSLNP